LDSYTHHGESITVRDLRGLTLPEVEKSLKESKLVYVISDSSYQSNMKPETVIDQEPKAGSKVKENRTIYITINARKAPKVKMPYLIDKSLRQAISELESRDLRVGERIYKPDIAKDAVLQQLYNGTPVDSGTMIPKGSTINLVLGSGFGQESVEVPSLVGLRYDEARLVLVENSLNVGSTIYDNTIGGSTQDTSDAKILKTIPASGSPIKMGEAVDLFFTKDVPDNAVDQNPQGSPGDDSTNP
jgi:beta-lactam-binding protein with PASTA domain